MSNMLDDFEVPALEDEDTYRVYFKEWVVAWTGWKEECEKYLSERFRLPDGRLRLPEDHMTVRPHRLLSGSMWQAVVHVWVLRGEFKREAAAQQFLHDMQQHYLSGSNGPGQVVVRGSREEATMRDFGVKVLK